MRKFSTIIYLMQASYNNLRKFLLMRDASVEGTWRGLNYNGKKIVLACLKVII